MRTTKLLHRATAESEPSCLCHRALSLAASACGRVVLTDELLQAAVVLEQLADVARSAWPQSATQPPPASSSPSGVAASATDMLSPCGDWPRPHCVSRLQPSETRQQQRSSTCRAVRAASPRPAALVCRPSCQQQATFPTSSPALGAAGFEPCCASLQAALSTAAFSSKPRARSVCAGSRKATRLPPSAGAQLFMFSKPMYQKLLRATSPDKLGSSADPAAAPEHWSPAELCRILEASIRSQLRQIA